MIIIRVDTDFYQNQKLDILSNLDDIFARTAAMTGRNRISVYILSTRGEISTK